VEFDRHIEALFDFLFGGIRKMAVDHNAIAAQVLRDSGDALKLLEPIAEPV
jgi:hypothetical protein